MAPTSPAPKSDRRRLLPQLRLKTHEAPGWRHFPGVRPRLAAALGGLLLCAGASAGAAEQPVNLLPAELVVGFSSSSFVNVNRNDAEAALKVMFETVARRRGYLIKSNPRIFDNYAGLEAAIQDGSLHIAILSSWQFLAMDIHRQTTPYFVPTVQGKVGRKYLVLTRKDSGMNTLADLRGKGITQLELSSATVGRQWLETLLLANHLGTREAFFGSVEAVSKPSAAVLPVFFGKKNACLVDESAWNMMKELNPQLGSALQVVISSETFLEIVLCLSNTGWLSDELKQQTVDALRDLHTEPAGQQILTLFKVGRLVPFQEAQMESVRRLRATYDQLQERARHEPAPDHTAPSRKNTFQPPGGTGGQEQTYHADGKH